MIGGTLEGEVGELQAGGVSFSDVLVDGDEDAALRRWLGGRVTRRRDDGAGGGVASSSVQYPPSARPIHSSSSLAISLTAVVLFAGVVTTPRFESQISFDRCLSSSSVVAGARAGSPAASATLAKNATGSAAVAGRV